MPLIVSEEQWARNNHAEISEFNKSVIVDEIWNAGKSFKHARTLLFDVVFLIRTW